MTVARVCALRSKDPNTQVGACIINQDQQIIATGYNGLPRNLDDNTYPWTREGDFLNTKYPYVVHAELNAILSATISLKQAKIYVSLFPCHECSKAIIQSGIKEIIYQDDKYLSSDSVIASKKMLNDAKVSYRILEQFKIVI